MIDWHHVTWSDKYFPALLGTLNEGMDLAYQKNVIRCILLEFVRTTCETSLLIGVAYTDHVANNFHLFMLFMFHPSSDCLFHQVCVICNKVQEHLHGFQVLRLLLHSTDLNPIQHVWDMLQISLNFLLIHPTIKTQTWTAMECAQIAIYNKPSTSQIPCYIK